MTSIIRPSSSAPNFKGSMVIVINGFYYRSSTSQWKEFNFCGSRLIDKDGLFYSMYQNCYKERDSKTIP
jgi:hypothetical protein